MKSLVLLFCLAQLWGCQSAPHNTGLGFKEVACDDPEVEQVALLAVDYLNQHLLHGFSHVLNRIDKVKLWFRRPVGVVYELELDTLETTCHVLDPTPPASLVQKLGGEEVSVACKDFQKQPQPASANTAGPAPAVDQAAPAVDQAAPAAPSAGSPASLVVGPMVVAVPPGPPAHRTHHDLRHAFSPVASVESASGEAVGPPKVVQPGMAGAAGPVAPLCPGRVRHFKI
ncbi:alpha-2-HS-glycoprotein isoform X3 [Cricetulus griseus]|uniref:Alpha-2-HS-glycoprotein n=1 Tax=Cricetulus griseus TaxID=10029 RepID=A0A9J7K7H1_CRIGR|nr:alpha-2-HS-glycoprotein isoform X3 [Cricetulus griseus]XP_035315586.1 alpha-2-HS-glycoprotein isoform X3 [Cricetulus griseus]